MTSNDLCWRHVRARIRHEPATAGEFSVPSTDCYRVVLVTAGRFVAEGALEASQPQEEWSYRALYGPGSVGLITPGTALAVRWQVVTREPVVTLQLRLDESVFAEALREFPGARRLPPAGCVVDDRIAGIAQDISWALENAAPAVYADSAARLLAARLATTDSLSTERGRRVQRGLAAADLARIVEYMCAHLSEQVTLDDLSAVVNLSKHYLLRQFKAAAGVPPLRYLQRMRMDHATRLLAGSDLTVSSVARICSYSSERQFAAAFARHTGLAPSRYRTARTATQAGPDIGPVTTFGG